MAANMKEVDGSLLEGGGQVLRIASAIAVLYKFPVKIHSIRAGRPKPGLKAQHLCGLELLAEASGGRLENARLDSQEVRLLPAPVSPTLSLLKGHVSTAGATTLLLQSALPVVALSSSGPVTLSLRGGTNVPFAPQIDFALHVFAPIAAKAGLRFDADIKRRGFFPKGGGEVEVVIQPVQKLKPIEIMERGDVTKLRAISCSTLRCSPKLRADLVSSAVAALAAVGVKVGVEELAGSGPGDGGLSLQLLAETSTGAVLSADALPKRGERVGEAGAAAGRSLARLLGTPAGVDEHLQDQLILPMALAEGESRIRTCALTLHTRTAIEIAQELMPPKLALELSMRLEGLASVRAEGDDFRYYFRLKCSSCGEVTEHWQYLAIDSKLEMPGSRGTAHYVAKCHFCSRQGSIEALPETRRPFAAAKEGQFQPVLLLDCRGWEPVDFDPRVGWVAEAAESSTVFSDIDLQEKEWCEYDEKANIPVGIYEFESRITVSKQK